MNAANRFLYKSDGSISKIAWVLLVAGSVYVVTWFVGLFGGIFYNYLIDPNLYIFAAVPFTGGVVARAWQMRAEAGYGGLNVFKQNDVNKLSDTPVKDTPSATTTAIPDSANFKLHEFHCKDGTPVPEQYYNNLQKLMNNLEVIRAANNNKPIKVNSGYRTKAWNISEGGSKASQHLTASAADIKAEGTSPLKLLTLIESLMTARKITAGGLKLYNTGHVHYDVRGTKATW